MHRHLTARRRRVLGAALGIAVAATTAAPASAHGPCGCTFPTVATPGQQITTGTAYRITWNPAPSDFDDEVTPRDLSGGYRADAPRRVVFEVPRREPVRRATFRVPQGTPPGLYLVLVHDGSEGGLHTTWDYVLVRGLPRMTAPRPLPAPRVPDADGDDGGRAAWVALGVGIGLVAAGAAAIVLRIRRRNARTP